MAAGPRTISDLGPWLAENFSLRGLPFKSIGFGWNTERRTWKCRIIWGERAYEGDDVILFNSLMNALNQALS